MTISVACPDCGSEFQIKDAMAGKQFRCKKCQAVVDVPTDAEDEWDEQPVKKSKSPSAAGRSAKGKKKRSSGSGSGLLKWVALGVGGVLLLGAIGFGVSQLPAPGGALTNNVGGVSWSSFTTADGHVTLKLPGNTEFARNLPNGADSMSMTSGKLTGSVASGNLLPPNGVIPPLESLVDAKKTFAMFTNVRIETINGQQMIRATMKGPTSTSETADFYVGNRIYIAMVGSPEALDPAMVDYFFNAIKTHP